MDAELPYTVERLSMLLTLPLKIIDRKCFRECDYVKRIERLQNKGRGFDLKVI